MKSVTGCRYTPALADPANCCITVNGSWWRPTISAPKMRSDGARTTGAAITIVTRRAAAAAASASAAWRRNVHHRGNDQSRPEQRPGANIAHQRRQAGGREERHAAGDGDLDQRK